MYNEQKDVQPSLSFKYSIIFQIFHLNSILLVTDMMTLGE